MYFFKEYIQINMSQFQEVLLKIICCSALIKIIQQPSDYKQICDFFQTKKSNYMTMEALASRLLEIKNSTISTTKMI